jgi:hypothetical protein
VRRAVSSYAVMRAGLCLLVGSLLALPVVGCGPVSRSSASFASLMSLSASFRSSSRSSGGGPRRLAVYRDDVRAATLAAVGSGAPGSDLLRRIGSVAERHGVTDWEAVPDTYRAVGEGLRLAGLEPSAAEAFAKDLVGDDAGALERLLEGYHS